MESVVIRCEYIWPAADRQGRLHSKTRVISFKTDDPSNWKIELADIPAWSFDGLSCGYTTQDQSTLLLRPIFASIDPNRKNAILVLCDVLYTDFTPHEYNYRSHLIDSYLEHHDKNALIGFGQDVRLKSNDESDLSVDSEVYHSQVGGRPPKQREIMEGLLGSCISSGLAIDSMLSEDSAGKWKFNIGNSTLNPVQACDHLLVSRFLLQRIAESLNYSVFYSLIDKLSVTLSTAETRDSKSSEYIISLAEKICSPSYKFVISSIYGTIKDPLTPDRWSCTESNAEVLLPWSIQTVGTGYLEDTRPYSGTDPYLLAKVLIDSICKDSA
jgi:glutamine synthetase